MCELEEEAAAAVDAESGGPPRTCEWMLHVLGGCEGKRMEVSNICGDFSHLCMVPGTEQEK